MLGLGVDLRITWAECLFFSADRAFSMATKILDHEIYYTRRNSLKMDQSITIITWVVAALLLPCGSSKADLPSLILFVILLL